MQARSVQQAQIDDTKQALQTTRRVRSPKHKHKEETQRPITQSPTVMDQEDEYYEKTMRGITRLSHTTGAPTTGNTQATQARTSTDADSMPMAFKEVRPPPWRERLPGTGIPIIPVK